MRGEGGGISDCIVVVPCIINVRGIIDPIDGGDLTPHNITTMVVVYFSLCVSVRMTHRRIIIIKRAYRFQ